MAQACTATAAFAFLGILAGCSTPPPGGLTEAETRYVAAVGPLDVHLANTGTALAVGKSVCAALAGGATPEQTAVKAQRFTGGEVAIDLKKATAIVEAARADLCA